MPKLLPRHEQLLEFWGESKYFYCGIYLLIKHNIFTRVHPKSRDIKIDNMSITFYGSELIQDTTLELNCGRRYGLIGLNGSGKSALLSALGNREVPIPEQ